MTVSKLHSPILITGADRSGSSLIARILYMCGVHKGNTNNMFERLYQTCQGDP